jgi:hypothetical protein
MIYKDVEPGSTPSETAMNWAKAIGGAGAALITRNVRGVQEWIKGTTKKGLKQCSQHL